MEMSTNTMNMFLRLNGISIKHKVKNRKATLKSKDIKLSKLSKIYEIKLFKENP